VMFLAQQRVNFRCQGKSCTVFGEEKGHTNRSTEDNSKDKKRQVLFLTLVVVQLLNSYRVHMKFMTKIAVSALQLFCQQQNVSSDHRSLFSSAGQSVGGRCFH